MASFSLHSIVMMATYLAASQCAAVFGEDPLLCSAINKNMHTCYDETDEMHTSLLQVSNDLSQESSPASKKQDLLLSEKDDHDIVFVHIPFDFGHTVERVATFGHVDVDTYLTQRTTIESSTAEDIDLGWAAAYELVQPGGAIWARSNPDLQAISDVTGCPMYYTPQKHWPAGLAQKTLGNKTVFSTLRDPYERLVAFFRGDDGDESFGGYGTGSLTEYFADCDVDGAVKQMMNDYKAGDIFAGGCKFLPQAEYFDGPFGSSLPINNRLFPVSLNEMYAERGYENLKITSQDELMHVTGCPNVWAGDLKEDTKALVREVYARDFELLCQHFGYCDDHELVCLPYVNGMCPEKAFAWDAEEEMFHPRTPLVQFADAPSVVLDAMAT